MIITMSGKEDAGRKTPDEKVDPYSVLRKQQVSSAQREPGVRTRCLCGRNACSIRNPCHGAC